MGSRHELRGVDRASSGEDGDGGRSRQLTMVTDSRLARGVEAFNAGEFFAAHEIWEELWLEMVGP